MTYAQYLQTGGSIQTGAKKKSLKDLALAVSRQQDQQAQQELLQRVDGIRRQADQEDIQEVQEIQQAAKNNDQDALEALQILQQAAQIIEQQTQTSQSQYARRGAKLKKACKGIKAENGMRVKKAGVGCSCLLKRSGGRLIQIDSCTGQIIR